MELAVRRLANVTFLFAVPNNIDPTLRFRLRSRLLAPVARDNIVRALACIPNNIHRNHCELRERAALQEENLVIFGQVE